MEFTTCESNIHSYLTFLILFKWRNAISLREPTNEEKFSKPPFQMVWAMRWKWKLKGVFLSGNSAPQASWTLY